VPGDISVTGYDNITFAAFGPVSLTTVDQAGHRIGGTAARLLLDRIADPAHPAAQVAFSPTLVVRRTTAPPPGDQ
jgi:LacI family transcriptional regulator